MSFFFCFSFVLLWSYEKERDGICGVKVSFLGPCIDGVWLLLLPPHVVSFLFPVSFYVYMSVGVGLYPDLHCRT